MSNLIQNAIRIKEYDIILWSRTTHDYEEYKGYSVDGGTDYSLISIPEDKTLDDIESLEIYDDEPIESMMKKLLWGTYGKDGNQPLKYVKLFECETDHLHNILKSQRISDYYKSVINYILEYRRLQTRKNKILKIKNLYK